MFKYKTLLVIGLSAFLAGTAWAGDPKPEEYTETIGNFKKIPAVDPFFGNNYGYAVFPTIGKGGLGIGAAHGKGQVYRGGTVTGMTAMTDVTIGFQVGGQAYSQIIFFQNADAYNNFTSGNFEFEAAAGAVAVTASAQAQTSTGGGSSAGASTSAEAGGDQTEAAYSKGLLTFVLGKGGLMYQAAIGGQKYSFDPVE